MKHVQSPDALAEVLCPTRVEALSQGCVTASRGEFGPQTAERMSLIAGGEQGGNAGVARGASQMDR